MTIKKVCYNLFLTKQEEKLLLETIKSVPSVAWIIIKKAHKRGDFFKEEKQQK